MARFPAVLQHSRLGERVGLFTRARQKLFRGCGPAPATGVKRSSGGSAALQSTASTSPLSSSRTPIRLTMPVHWAPGDRWTSLALTMRGEPEIQLVFVVEARLRPWAFLLETLELLVEGSTGVYGHDATQRLSQKAAVQLQKILAGFGLPLANGLAVQWGGAEAVSQSQILPLSGIGVQSLFGRRAGLARAGREGTIDPEETDANGRAATRSTISSA